MQHPDEPLFEIPLPAKKIDQFSKMLRLQMNGQGVNGEIATQEVQFMELCSTRGKAAGWS